MSLRYRTFSQFLMEHFGEKVFKLTIDAGFTCPNIDGRLATGGCVYCSEGSRPYGVDPDLSIKEQLEKNIDILQDRIDVKKFIAYFQTYTNTYAPTDVLRKKYMEALCRPDIVGLAVSTRPDCLSNETVDMLGEIAKERYVQLEIGLQTIHDSTLGKLNRWHKFRDFKTCMGKLTGKNFDVVVHIMLGLPGESVQMMHETVEETVRFEAVDGIKFHNLHVIDGTRLAEMYKRGEVGMFEEEQYINLVADLLEKVPSHIVIHRLVGEAHPKKLIAPLWLIRNKENILRKINEELERRGNFQGSAIIGSGSLQVESRLAL